MKIFTAPSESAVFLSERENVGPSLRLRVAYLLSIFPCWSETFIAEEVRHLEEEGFDITIMSLKRASEAHVHEIARTLLRRTLYADSYFKILAAQIYFAFKKPRVYIETFCRMMIGCQGNPLQLAKLLATFFLAVYFAGIVEKHSFERIHAHWATYPATAAWIVESLTGRPFSFTTHAHDLFLADKLLKKKCERADFIVTISEYNRQLLRRLGVSTTKVRVIHCGVDVRKFAPLGQYQWNSRRILAVGRLAQIKGFEVLVDACRILQLEGVDFSCEIVGEGPLRGALQKQIENTGMTDRVHLSGFASQGEVRRKLTESAMFVLPSRQTANGDQDGIPVALMEALAVGIPVVSTSVSGIPELVRDGVTGLSVPQGDAQKLAAAIRILLSDRDKCADLARRGRALVLDEFDARKNAIQLGKLFMEQT